MYFDTLDCYILLKKLSYYGVVGVDLTLFKKYLTEQCPYVQFNHLMIAVHQKKILGGQITLKNQKSYFLYYQDIQYNLNLKYVHIPS